MRTWGRLYVFDDEYRTAETLCNRCKGYGSTRVKSFPVYYDSIALPFYIRCGSCFRKLGKGDVPVLKDNCMLPDKFPDIYAGTTQPTPSDQEFPFVPDVLSYNQFANYLYSDSALPESVQLPAQRHPDSSEEQR